MPLNNAVETSTSTERVEVLASDSSQPFRFTGREWDSETGMYYYRMRTYSPVLKRFITEDPIRFASGDVNFYRYVGNNPTNYVDPLGFWSNPLPHLPSITQSFPSSDLVAPIADIVVGGIEVGGAVVGAVMTGALLVVGPETAGLSFPLAAGIAGGTALAAMDGISRIIEGINALADLPAGREDKEAKACQ